MLCVQVQDTVQYFELSVAQNSFDKLYRMISKYTKKCITVHIDLILPTSSITSLFIPFHVNRSLILLIVLLMPR